MSVDTWSSLKNTLFSPFAEKKHSSFRVLGLLTVVSLTFLLAPPLQVPTEPLKVGDISSRDIKAPADFSVEDKSTTVTRQDEAISQLLAIYDFDPDRDRVINKIDMLFVKNSQLLFHEAEEKLVAPIAVSDAETAARQGVAPKVELIPAAPKPKELSLEERWRMLAREEVLPISFATFKTLQNPLFNRSLKQTARSLAVTVMERGIVGNKELLLKEKEKGIVKRNLRNKSEVVINDINPLWGMEEAKQYIRQQGPKIFVADEFSLQAAIEITQLAIQPNFFFNKSATEESKQKLLQSVKPVYFQVKKGEMIVREGERVREDQVVKLIAFRLLRRQRMPAIFLTGVAFLVFLLLYLMSLYLKKFRPQIIANINQMYLLTVILITTFVLSRFFIFLSNALSAFTPQISVSAYSYAIPFALGGMLVAVLVDAQLGIIFSAMVGIFAAIQMGGEFVFFLLASIGGIGAVYGITHTRQRTALLRAGLVVCIANLAVIIPINLMSVKPLTPALLYECLGGVAAGLLVAIIVSALIPVLENVFKVTTDIKLLELSNMEQPVLKRLALEAPGTYQHSIVVGSLAEAAAEAIGANPLLARVSAYYHDVGKIPKAEYFVENQAGLKESKHKKLAPSMSSLIINSHVKEGMEFAKQYKLPPLIMDTIQQHHGTGLIQFFYQKAKQQEKPDVEVVKKEDYCYPGPRPQTKENGIIMLADVLEASSRTLGEPTPQKLEELVHRTIHDIYNAGQLDDCDLTLKNLNQIASAFVRILTSVFHARIEYPRLETANNREDSWTSTSETNKPTRKFRQIP